MEGLGQVRVDGCNIRESLVNYAIGGMTIDLIRLQVLESGHNSISKLLRGKRVSRETTVQRARVWWKRAGHPAENHS